MKGDALDRVPCAVLRQRLQLPNLAALLLECRLRWFGHAARRASAGFMRELIAPDVPRTWRKRTGERLKDEAEGGISNGRRLQ